MSFATKRRWVLALLLFIAVWPLAHRALVASFQVDPWRLGGWAMYCTPKLRVEVSLVPERQGQPVELELPAELRDSANRFAARRAVLGRFVRPTLLAREALDRLDIESVVVTIQRDRLDPDTKRIVGTREYLRYSLDEERRLRGGRFSIRQVP
jgi:hypothetical protein